MRVNRTKVVFMVTTFQNGEMIDSNSGHETTFLENFIKFLKNNTQMVLHCYEFRIYDYSNNDENTSSLI